MKKTLLSALLVMTVVACAGEQSPAPASSPADSPSTPEQVTAAEAPANAETANPVDRIELDVETGQYNTQSGELVNGSLVNNRQAGYLIFGPYTALQAGSYVATFAGQIQEIPAPGEVRVDVVSNKGASTHAVEMLRTAGELPALEFTLPEAVGDLEVRVHAPSGAMVSVSSYRVERKG